MYCLWWWFFNLVAWRFLIQLPNLLYANSRVLWVLDREYTLNIALIAKLNIHQFAFDSNFPNLMFTKCTVYTVYDFTFYLYTHYPLQKMAVVMENLQRLTVHYNLCEKLLLVSMLFLLVFIYSLMFLLYRLHDYERNQWGLMEPAECLRLSKVVGKPALSLFVDFTMFLLCKVIKRNSLVWWSGYARLQEEPNSIALIGICLW